MSSNTEITERIRSSFVRLSFGEVGFARFARITFGSSDPAVSSCARAHTSPCEHVLANWPPSGKGFGFPSEAVFSSRNESLTP